MLLRKITKVAFDALPDVMKGEYKPNTANAEEYLLDTDEASELLAARDREKVRADKLQKAIDDAKTEQDRIVAEATEAAAEAARAKGDVKAIEASWQAKLDAAKVAADAAIAKLTDKLRKLLVHDRAVSIAAEISTVPSLMVPVIEARLSAELEGEEPITRVLDAAGKPTATSIDDFKKELVANKEYASIIKAAGSSGGSAGGGSGGGSATKKLSEMTEAEKVALAQDNPAEFTRLNNEMRAAANQHRRR